jgi:dTDP-4-amino-4,6-dideoxygalactose transaminase
LAPKKKTATLPITEEVHATTLSLPISYAHTPEQIERVIEVLNRF